MVGTGKTPKTTQAQTHTIMAVQPFPLAGKNYHGGSSQNSIDNLLIVSELSRIYTRMYNDKIKK